VGNAHFVHDLAAAEARKAEIEEAIALSLGLLTSLHNRVFGDWTPGTEEQSTQE